MKKFLTTAATIAALAAPASAEIIVQFPEDYAGWRVTLYTGEDMACQPASLVDGGWPAYFFALDLTWSGEIYSEPMPDPHTAGRVFELQSLGLIFNDDGEPILSVLAGVSLATDEICVMSIAAFVGEPA